MVASRKVSQDAKEAKAAIRKIGTNALPYALRWIQEKPTGDFWSEEDVLSRCDLAVDVFTLLGPAASPAIPELVNIACTDNIGSGHAVNSLAGMGPVALSALLGIVTNTNATIGLRRHAISTLERAGTNAIPAVPAIIFCLDDPDLEIKVAAMDVLRKLILKSPAAFSAVTNKLGDPELCIRLRAFRALVDYGPDARPAIPALILQLDDENPRVRRFVTNALHAIAPDIYTNVARPQFHTSASRR